MTKKTKSDTKIIDYTNVVMPFHYSNYAFTTENSIDIKDTHIQNAEKMLERAKNQVLINNVIMDIDLAIKIELSIFEYSLLYCLNNGYNENFLKPVYDHKINDIITNLDANNKINNKILKKNIINGKINPSDVGFMSPTQLNPEKWSYWIKKKEHLEWKESSITYSSAYKCRKCGESKAQISQRQARSADEPMTTFIKCMVCKNTFKLQE
jgi:DNA-directed RNA polymerase subunit M/transcription elongation factor TFIIS